MKFGQQVRKEEALPLYEFHGKKQGTPTMGGLFIVAGLVAGLLFFGDLSGSGR